MQRLGASVFDTGNTEIPGDTKKQQVSVLWTDENRQDQTIHKAQIHEM